MRFTLNGFTRQEIQKIKSHLFNALSSINRSLLGAAWMLMQTCSVSAFKLSTQNDDYSTMMEIDPPYDYSASPRAPGAAFADAINELKTQYHKLGLTIIPGNAPSLGYPPQENVFYEPDTDWPVLSLTAYYNHTNASRTMLHRDQLTLLPTLTNKLLTLVTREEQAQTSALTRALVMTLTYAFTEVVFAKIELTKFKATRCHKVQPGYLFSIALLFTTLMIMSLVARDTAIYYDPDNHSEMMAVIFTDMVIGAAAGPVVSSLAHLPRIVTNIFSECRRNRQHQHNLLHLDDQGVEVEGTTNYGASS